MKNIVLLSSYILLASNLGCLGQGLENNRLKTGPSSSNPLVTILDKKVDARTRHFMMHERTVGLAIGILKNGKTTFYGYGETAKGNKKLPDENTIFEIGSITKTFTATLLAYAVYDGKLRVDDPINKYIPDSIPPIQYKGIPVTLKTLANHTSGVPDFPINFHFPDEQNYHAGDPFKDYSDSDLFSFYVHYKLTRKPGEKLEYSNLAAATLGVTLEKVYNMSYDSLVQMKICYPLGMNDTRQYFPADSAIRLAQGYMPDSRPALAWHYKAIAGAAALRSTVSDLIKYAEGNIGTAPPGLNEAMTNTHQLTFLEKRIGIGLGWIINRSGTHEWLMHDGATGGFKSIITIDVQKKTAVVILANTVVDLQDLMGDIMDLAEHNEQ